MVGAVGIELKAMLIIRKLSDSIKRKKHQKHLIRPTGVHPGYTPPENRQHVWGGGPAARKWIKCHRTPSFARRLTLLSHSERTASTARAFSRSRYAGPTSGLRPSPLLTPVRSSWREPVGRFAAWSAIFPDHAEQSLPVPR
jgi:hypothetical protein